MHLVKDHSEGSFPIADQIRAAASAEQRAVILLRVPDVVLLQMTGSLRAACNDTDFELGVAFIDARVSSLCAVREEDGRLPRHDEVMSEKYRWLMAQLAGISP